MSGDDWLKSVGCLTVIVFLTVFWGLVAWVAWRALSG